MGEPISPEDEQVLAGTAIDCAKWDHFLFTCGLEPDHYWFVGCLYVWQYSIEILPGLCDAYFLLYAELRI